METALLIAAIVVLLHILDDLIILNIGRNIWRKFFGQPRTVAM